MLPGDIKYLDNPAWHSLSLAHVALSSGDRRARRYQPDVSPMAGIDNDSNLSELSDIFEPGETTMLIFPTSRQMPKHPDWRELDRIPIYQMVCVETNSDDAALPGQLLIESDELDMLKLARDTEPGPFEIQTRRFGDYYGVRDASNRLVAMAGERLRMPGWIEVSGVCTHSSARGQGLASALVKQVMQPIFAANCSAFLHVREGSTSGKSAIAVYERLGFRYHQAMTANVIERL